jgi:hypothetical protein
MEPSILLKGLMYVPIPNVSYDTEQYPHAKIACNEQENQLHVVRTVAN